MGTACVRLCGEESNSPADKSRESPVPMRHGAPSPLGTNQVTLAHVVGVPEARAGPNAQNGTDSSDEEFAFSATHQRKSEPNSDSFPHVAAIQHLRKLQQSHQRTAHGTAESAEASSNKALLLSFGKPRSPSLASKDADASVDRGARVAERSSLMHSNDSSEAEVGSRGSSRKEGKKSSKRDKREKKARRAEKRAKKELLREQAQIPHAVASQSLSSASFTDPLDMSHRSSTFSESSAGGAGLPPVAVTASPRVGRGA